MATPQWTLQGILQDASGDPVAGMTVTVAPPGLPYNTPWGTVINQPVAAKSEDDGSFLLRVASINGTNWSITIGDDDPVVIPDPGDTSVIDVNLITPAYVPAWNGGEMVPQGVGISGVAMNSNGQLVFSLGNGTSLPPLNVPQLSQDVHSVAGRSGDVILTSDDITDGDSRWGNPLLTSLSERGISLFRQAVRNNQARVAVLGAGGAEGEGASVLTNRWQDTLRDSLREALTLTDNTGVGYIPAHYGFGGAYPSPRIAGALNVDYSLSSHSGYGNRGVRLLTSSSSISWLSQQCRYITIHWSNSFNAPGVFQVQVDNKAPVTISTLSVNPDTEGRQVIDLGVAGPHAVTVTWVSGSPIIEGVSFDTATTGLTWRDSTHSGFTADMLVNGDGIDTQMPSLGLASLATFDPHLVIVNLGTDDMAQAISDTSVAQWQQNLIQLFTELGNQCPHAGVLFVHDPMRVEDARSATDGDTPRKLLEYQIAAQRAAAQVQNVSVLLLSSLWEPRNVQVANPLSPVEQDPSGWLADKQNPSDSAHTQISAFLAQAILGSSIVDCFVKVAHDVESFIATTNQNSTQWITSSQLDAQVASLVNADAQNFTQMAGDGRWVTKTTLDSSVSQLVGANSATQSALAQSFLTAANLSALDYKSTRNRRGTTPAFLGAYMGTLKIAVLGDSKVEGVGVSTRASRWISALQTLLREYIDPSGQSDQGEGYIPIQYAGATSFSGATLGGVSGTDYSVVNYVGGPGVRAVQLMTAAGTATYSNMNVRYLTVGYLKTNWNPGQIQVSVDGAVIGTIDTTGTSSSSGITYSYAQQVFDLGSVGVHNVVLSTTNGYSTVCGCYFETSQTGVKVADFGHDGYTLNQFNTGQVFHGDTTSDDLNLAALQAFGPDIVIVACGGQDLGGMNWFLPFDVTQYKKDWTVFTSRIRSSLPKAGIIGLHGAMRVEDARSATQTDSPGKLALAEDAMREGLFSDPIASALYESELWQPMNANPADPKKPVEQDPIGWLIDSYNMTMFGHLRLGTYVYDSLLDRGTDFLKAARLLGGAQSRPPTTLAVTGSAFFDTKLGKPIWWNGTNWVDSTGASV